MIDYSLYLCTNSEMNVDYPLEYCVEQSILGGVTIVQIREKEKNYDHGLGDLISKWFGKNNNGNMNAGEIDCNQVIQGKLGEYLTKIFSIMKYLGIVLCVGITIYDFVKALLDSDKEIMNKLVKKAFTRLILVAVLFFLPTFVNLIIKLFVDNPCEIKF